MRAAMSRKTRIWDGILTAACVETDKRAQSRYSTDEYLDVRIEQAREYIEENGEEDSGGTPHASYDVADPLGDSLPDAFATLDKRFAYVNQGGKSAYIRRPDPDRPHDEILEVWTSESFNAYHADRPVFEECETADGVKTVKLNPAKEWLGDARRYSRVTFAPPPLFAGANAYNLWDCFTPPKGDPSIGCDLFKSFLLDIICDGREGLCDWVWMWLAHAVQFPGEKPGTCLVLQGDGGSGKSTFGEIMHEIWGQFSVHASNPDHVTGKFNKHQATAIMMVSDEALYGGDVKVSSIIKDMVTGKKQRVEQKFMDSFEVDSCLRCIFIGNPKKVIPIEANGSDRRYLCVSVSNAKRGDTTYFAELRYEAENGGLAALYGDLLEFDPDTVGLSWADVREAPLTKERRIMRGLSLRPVIRALIDVVEDGILEVREESGRTVHYKLAEDVPTNIEKSHVRAALRRSANNRDSRDDTNEVLEELFGEGTVESKRCAARFNVVDSSGDFETGSANGEVCVAVHTKERAHCYVFPALRELRAMLGERFGSIDSPED